MWRASLHSPLPPPDVTWPGTYRSRSTTRSSRPDRLCHVRSVPYPVLLRGAESSVPVLPADDAGNDSDAGSRTVEPSVRDHLGRTFPVRNRTYWKPRRRVQAWSALGVESRGAAAECARPCSVGFSGILVKTCESLKLSSDPPVPSDLAFVPFVGGREPGGSRHGGGCPMFGMDVGDDRVHRLLAEPSDESSGCFGGDAASMPRGPHHPGDLGDGALAGRADRRLDCARQAGLVTKPDHPVQPGHGGIGRACGHALVARAQGLGGLRRAAGESVQGRIGQHCGHLFGALDSQWQQVEPAGVDGLGYEGSHAATVRGVR